MRQANIWEMEEVTDVEFKPEGIIITLGENEVVGVIAKEDIEGLRRDVTNGVKMYWFTKTDALMVSFSRFDRWYKNYSRFLLGTLREEIKWDKRIGVVINVGQNSMNKVVESFGLAEGMQYFQMLDTIMIELEDYIVDAARLSEDAELLKSI